MPGYIAGLRRMTPQELDRELDSKISDSYHQINDDPVFVNACNGTNASGWSVEEYDPVDALANTDLSGSEVRIPITYSADGEQEEDMGHLGTRITGDAEAVIDDDGNVTCEEVTAEVDLGED